MRRRDLLRLAMFAAWPASGGAWAGASKRAASIQAPTRTLVLVELKGGNDGLNTLVPYADEAYYRLRPRLAIAADAVLALDERIGLHPALKPLMPAWSAGDLAWTQGVGYDHPSRSHFRSIDIWETATDADVVSEVGWIPQVLPAGASGAFPQLVILAGDDGIARGSGMQAISLWTPERFARTVARLGNRGPAHAHTEALSHIIAVRDAARQAGRTFEHMLTRLPDVPDKFPQSPLGRQLQQAARMLLAGMDIPVIKVQIGSFDTHSKQLARHERLLKQLAEALAAFREAMVAAGRWDQTLVVSYSEFGRQVRENGSFGTDHGTAAPHLAMGGRVKGGLYGLPPDLNNLEQKDIRHTVEFRQLYATIAERWWRLERHPWRGRFPAMEWI